SGDRVLGLREAAARGILGRRVADLGGAPRCHRMARDLRVLHARADGAGLRAVADEGWPRLGARAPAADEIGRALRAELLDVLAVCRQGKDLARAIRGRLALGAERQLAGDHERTDVERVGVRLVMDVRCDRANLDIVEALFEKRGFEFAFVHGVVLQMTRAVYTRALFR